MALPNTSIPSSFSIFKLTSSPIILTSVTVGCFNALTIISLLLSILLLSFIGTFIASVYVNFLLHTAVFVSLSYEYYTFTLNELDILTLP